MDDAGYHAFVEADGEKGSFVIIMIIFTVQRLFIDGLGKGKRNCLLYAWKWSKNMHVEFGTDLKNSRKKIMGIHINCFINSVRSTGSVCTT